MISTVSSVFAGLRRRPLVTAEGMQAILEYNKNLHIAREETLNRMVMARSDGDFSENDPYKAEKRALELIDARLTELRQFLTECEIARTPPDSTIIRFGAKVTVLREGDSIPLHFRIGSQFEAQLCGEEFLYLDAPLPKALIGARANQSVVIGGRAHTVISIEYPSSQYSSSH